MKPVTFIDLFAGIGGFHTGLTALGAKCVYASEINEDLRLLYQKNYGIYPEGDIKEVTPASIPTHDIACAGFPCVSYSAAGSQLGHKCPQWGGLVDHALELMFKKKSKLIFLENVDNLVRLDNGDALDTILRKMEKNGYTADYQIFSPHQFGIPQHRKRVYIVGSRYGLKRFHWPKPEENKWHLSNALSFEGKIKNPRLLEAEKENVLNLWQELLNKFSGNEPGLSGVIFAAECGATYPHDVDFGKVPVKTLRQYKGAFGADLSDCRTRLELMEKLPPYVRNVQGKLPAWKQEAIKHSRAIFAQHKKSLPSDWMQEMKRNGCNSWQRLEWRADRSDFDIWKYIIQFRPSGIRVSRRTKFPCFVAVHSTQTPIMGWKKRYINSKEALLLQGLGKMRYNMATESQMMRAVGNAVNAHVVSAISHHLIREIK